MKMLDEVETVHRKLARGREMGDSFTFKSYGVIVRLESNSAELLADARAAAEKALLGRMKSLDATAEAEQVFSFHRTDETVLLYRNGKEISSGNHGKPLFFWFDGLIRIAVGEFAKEHVFVHAGVVGWKGKAIIIPGRSFQGKTTLVVELVKAGAHYYSDEYAIFDENGLVHSFPRDVSIRTRVGNIREDQISIESVGGTVGSDPLPVGAVLITEYAEDAVWDPQILTPGEGVMQIIPHTLPLNVSPERSLRVLKRATSDAIIVKSIRGEADKYAKVVLDFVDSTTV
jgi:hypothetical protein